MYIHLLGMGWRCWSKQQPYFHLPHPHGWSKAAPRNGSTPRLAGNSAIWQKQKGKKMQNFHVFHVHSCVKWYLHAHTHTPTHIHTQRCNGVKCIGIRKKNMYNVDFLCQHTCREGRSAWATIREIHGTKLGGVGHFKWRVAVQPWKLRCLGGKSPQGPHKQRRHPSELMMLMD